MKQKKGMVKARALTKPFFLFSLPGCVKNRKPLSVTFLLITFCFSTNLLFVKVWEKDSTDITDFFWPSGVAKT